MYPVMIFATLTAVFSITSMAYELETVEEATGDDPIDTSDRYIITLKPDVNLADHLSSINSLHTDTTTMANDPNHTFKGITHQYTLPNFQAYAGHFSPTVMSALRSHTAISSIEPDTLWTTGHLTVAPSTGYGLGLISHRALPSPAWNTYPHDPSSGINTTAYILDSGIHIAHADFGHRATRGYNAVDPGAADAPDVFGHGTHVAGLIGGEHYGVAKRCALVAVRVVKRRDGRLADVIDGYQWAAKDVMEKTRAAKAVVHVSVYGPPSRAFDNAVDAAGAKGVSTVCAAGNEGNDGPTSPGRAKGVVTVSATDQRRRRAPFANYGKNVNIFAPGVGIESTWIHGTQRVSKVSGTAQAAAFVAGLVLYFKALEDLPDAEKTTAYLLKQAIANAVTEPDMRRKPFAYNGCGK